MTVTPCQHGDLWPWSYPEYSAKINWLLNNRGLSILHSWQSQFPRLVGPREFTHKLISQDWWLFTVWFCFYTCLKVKYYKNILKWLRMFLIWKIEKVFETDINFKRKYLQIETPITLQLKLQKAKYKNANTWNYCLVSHSLLKGKHHSKKG